MFKKHLSLLLLVLTLVTIIVPIQVTYASAADVVNSLTGSTMPNNDVAGGNIISKIFNFLFDKLLGPIFNILKGGEPAASIPVTPTNPAKPSTPIQDNGVLRGKTIVVDPGHGGSNPGAVANNTQEKDNNLAVALKLQDKLLQAGAKVVMTRSTDRTVAPEGSSLGQELQARVDLAEANHADIFVSLHSNENNDSNIKGTMTFYNTDQSSQLAQEVQNAVIEQTQSVDKGVSHATFYVLRNTSMPSILIEMGFVSNPDEAAKLASDAYRERMAQGAYNGIVKYFNKQ